MPTTQSKQTGTIRQLELRLRAAGDVKGQGERKFAPGCAEDTESDRHRVDLSDDGDGDTDGDRWRFRLVHKGLGIWLSVQ